MFPDKVVSMFVSFFLSFFLYACLVLFLQTLVGTMQEHKQSTRNNLVIVKTYYLVDRI